MRLKDRPLLGIEIHEGELRLAVVSQQGAVLQVDGAAHGRLAPGTVRNGVVLDTGSVAVALKRLIASHGLAEFKDAVIGIPVGGTVVRNLQVPPVPDEELVGIIAGEVDHYAIVTPSGSHAFLRIHAPAKTTSELVSVVVAGTEASVITSLSELAERAGLNIVSIEPVEFALNRMALATLGPQPTVFVLSATQSSTGLSFIREGKLWAYRQIDIGANSLVPRGLPTPGDPEALLEPTLEASSVLALSKEVQRMLEFLGRAHPSEVEQATLHLATNEPTLRGLANALSAQIQRGVSLHIPGDSILSTPASKAELATSGAVRYSAAVGLALRANRAATEVAPPVDLFASERLTIKADIEKRMVALGLAFGAAALVLGIIGMIAIEGAIGTKSKMVAVLEGQATTIKQSTSQSLKSRAGDVEQYRLLRSEGSPVVPLMDYLTSAMPPQTSLTAITVDAARQARISGESVSEDGVMALLRPLQSVPVITEPRLDSMKVDPEKGGYTFTITGQLVGMDQVRLPRPVGVTP